MALMRIQTGPLRFLTMQSPGQKNIPISTLCLEIMSGHISQRGKSTKIKGLCFRDLKISFHIGKDALNLTSQIISNSLRQCPILSRLLMECSFLILDLRTRSDQLKYLMSLLTADIPVQFCMTFCGIGMTEQLTIQKMMSIVSLILSAQKLWLWATVR